LAARSRAEKDGGVIDDEVVKMLSDTIAVE